MSRHRYATYDKATEFGGFDEKEDDVVDDDDKANFGQPILSNPRTGQSTTSAPLTDGTNGFRGASSSSQPKPRSTGHIKD